MDLYFFRTDLDITWVIPNKFKLVDFDQTWFWHDLDFLFATDFQFPELSKIILFAAKLFYLFSKHEVQSISMRFWKYHPYTGFNRFESAYLQSIHIQVIEKSSPNTLGVFALLFVSFFGLKGLRFSLELKISR